MSDILLENGDVKRDERGFPAVADGAQALVQRAMIRLSVRRGSFLQDPQLGSTLHTLGAVPPEQRGALALSLARQALAALPEVSAEEAVCVRDGEALRLTFGLQINGEKNTVEVQVQ